MEFNLPTTKSEMYAVLRELFSYYRVRHSTFMGVDLVPIKLTRLNYVPPTDGQLTVLADTLVTAKHEREKQKYKDDIETEISELEEKIVALNLSEQAKIEKVEFAYAQSQQKLREHAVSAGLTGTSIIADKIVQLETEKNKELLAITMNVQGLISECTARKNALNEKLGGADEYFSVLFEHDKNEKMIELKAEREKAIADAFKYNNQLDEKEQSSHNNIEQVRASFELRFIDMSNGDFTKDQLIEMGYYSDVIRCIKGYYDRLSPVEAYEDFYSEGDLVAYLDHYYQEILYAFYLKSL